MPELVGHIIYCKKGQKLFVREADLIAAALRLDMADQKDVSHPLQGVELTFHVDTYLLVEYINGQVYAVLDAREDRPGLSISVGIPIYEPEAGPWKHVFDAIRKRGLHGVPMAGNEDKLLVYEDEYLFMPSGRALIINQAQLDDLLGS